MKIPSDRDWKKYILKNTESCLLRKVLSAKTANQERNEKIVIVIRCHKVFFVLIFIVVVPPAQHPNTAPFSWEIEIETMKILSGFLFFCTRRKHLLLFCNLYLFFRWARKILVLGYMHNNEKKNQIIALTHTYKQYELGSEMNKRKNKDLLIMRNNWVEPIEF